MANNTRNIVICHGAAPSIGKLESILRNLPAVRTILADEGSGQRAYVPDAVRELSHADFGSVQEFNVSLWDLAIGKSNVHQALQRLDAQTHWNGLAPSNDLHPDIELNSGSEDEWLLWAFESAWETPAQGLTQLSGLCPAVVFYVRCDWQVAPANVMILDGKITDVREAGGLLPTYRDIPWKSLSGLDSYDEEAPYSRDHGTDVVYSADFEADGALDGALEGFFELCAEGADERLDEFAALSSLIHVGSVIILNMICEDEGLRVHLCADSRGAYFSTAD